MKNSNLLNRLLSYSHEKQKVRSVRRYAAMLPLLVVCVTHAWAYDFYKNVYFDNSTKGWSYVSLVIGKDEGSQAYYFTKLNNCNLWYKWMSWNGFNDMYFVNYNWNDENWWSGYDCCRPYARVSGKDYWGPYKQDYKGGGRVYFDGVNNSSAAGDLPTYTATLKVKKSTDGGDYTEITSGSWPATLNLKGTYMNGDDKTGQSDFDTSTGDKATYGSIPVTGEVTMTLGASADSKYEFVGWGTGSSASTATTPYTYNITGNTTYYAFFRTKQYTIAYNGGANAESGSHASDTKYHSTSLTLPDAVFTRAGYAQTGWATSDGGAQAYALGATYTSNSAVTLYPVWTAEVTHDVTVYYKCNGNLIGDESDTESGVGVTTTRNVTAPTIYGYTFSSWTLGNGIVNRTAGSSTTTNPIVINTNATDDYVLTANYTEDLSSPYIVEGGNKIVTTGTTWRTTADAYNKMNKKTGYSSTYDTYFTVDVTAVNQGSANSNYQFKIYNTSTSTHYGLTGSGQYYLNRAESGTAKALSSPGINVELRADALGEYELKVNYSSDPTLTVTYPTAYAVTFGKGTGGSTVYAKYNTVSFNSGTKVQSGKTVQFTQTASTGYQFKEWNTKSNGSGTQLSTSATYDHTVGATNNVYAIYNPKQYTITLNDQDATTAVSPSTVNATYKSLTLSSAITNPLKSGYTFGGWYSATGGGGSLIINTSGALQASKDGYTDATGWTKTSAATVYAKWTQVLTLDKNGGTTDGGLTVIYKKSATSGHTAATRTGYTLAGYYDADDGGNKIINADGSLVSYSASVSSYIKTDGSWGYNGTPTLYAHWTANQYDVTLKPNGATTGSDQVVRATFDATMPTSTKTSVALVAPTKTGYTLQGFYQNSDGTGTKYYNANMTSANNWDQANTANVWAKWSANNYTVTLNYDDEEGYGSKGEGVKDEVSATYEATMPTMGTAPTPLPGWKFMGYFTGHDGDGTKYYNADGSSATNWNIASATTLYAHFQKTEITSLTHPSSIASGHEVYLVVEPVFNQTGAQPNMQICWKLLYADNDNEVESGVEVESYTEGDTKPNQVRFTLTDVSAGYYKVQAVLYANSSAMASCNDGTELSTIKSNLRIAGNSKVTIQYKDNSGNTLFESRTIEIASGESAGVKAPSMIGYTFSSWTVDPVLTNTCADGASCGTGKDSINISAAYDGYLTANYTKKDMIYFNNTVGWEHVYVYFYSSDAYWDDDKGTGAQYDKYVDSKQAHLRHFWGEMTQIGTSNVYYFDYQAAAAIIDPTYASEINDYTNVAFTKDAQGYTDAVNKGYEFFYETEAIRRGDFAHNKSMFVPLSSPTTKKNSNTTTYYDQGYWMNYPDNTGYTLKIYDNKSDGAEKKSLDFPFPADKKMPMSITTDLEGGKTYGFKIVRVGGTEFGNANTMSNGHSGDEGQKVWEFTDDKGRCGLMTSSAGDYTFTLTYGEDESHNFNYLVGVHYPEATGDYRVLYKDNVHTAWKPSAVIPKSLDKDTISYFVRKGESPVMKLQKCSATYNEGTGVTTVTWSDTVANLISSLPSAITADGVYYFCLNKKADGTRELGDTKPYEGNFYIRVDGAGYSNWDYFRASDHLMPYSDYSFKQTTNPYSHYFTKWYDCSGGNKNIKFVVANDYSVCISDTLDRETATGQWEHIGDYIDGVGNLNRSANVRFMYNYKTNEVSRAFIDGAYADGGNFLKILAQTKDGIYLVPSGEAGDPQTEITFKDNGNWVYEKTVYAVPGARYKLRSLFGNPAGNIITQYFKGGSGTASTDSATLIGGDGVSRLQIRLLYDFKTNRVVTAYQPTGTIDTDLAIHADIMFMREHQGDVQQITFAEGRKITDIENIYCGLRFNKWTLNNRKTDGDNGYLDELLSRYERDIFYVSFPYDVRLSDVIGFGTYGTHWIVEYYNGAERAKNGFWSDSESYWHFVTPAMKDTFTLKAGTGYIVALDLDELYCFKSGGIITQASVWTNTSEVELLFPGKVTSISNVDVTYNMPAHTCTINRGTTAGNRTKKDSHWNVLGVPTFKNITGADSDDGVGSGELVFANKAWVKDSLGMKFIYDGNLADNSLTAKAVKDFEFKAMHSYVVQYFGNVTFTTSATPAPASVAARTYAEAPQEVDFRLELNKDGVLEDQTFVSLSNDEKVSADFEFGEDMSKEFNSNRANIYTFIGTEWVAGNTLPMTNQTTIVPVGVKIAADGEYTFSIPEGTYGVGITLIDNEAGARVNLGLMDYTLTLNAGQIDDRFVLEISPIQQISTDLESISDEGLEIRGARKIMIDGLLYIVKDGKVFDARGNRVK